MNKKKILKVLAFIVGLALVIGYGIFAFSSWKGYQKEMTAKTVSESGEITEVFHDQGDIYMNPVAPSTKDDVTIRLRSGRYQVSKAQIQMTLDKGTTWQCIDMEYEEPDETGYYDLWIGTIPAQSEPYFYRFAVGNDISGTTMYLGCEGIRSYQIDTNEMFYVIPGFDTPEWSQGTMWYYAHMGQFYNGDTSNDLYREYLMKDNTYGNDAQSMLRGSGDIQGLKEKLDYIQDLGVKSIAVGPFFSSSETLGFGSDNMAAVETAFGTEEQMQSLIQEIHDRGMKITTDMIISYSTSYSKYFNNYGLFPSEGAYQSQTSPYYPLFKFPQWPYNAVKIWGSMGLNIEDEEAAKLIYGNEDSMLQKYLREPYGLDGYRFDAEESVGNLGYDYDPETYFVGIRESLKGISEDKLMLSENCVGVADQYNTLFDSSWQKNGYFSMKSWMSGKATGSELLKVLQDNLINTARPRALSSYNFLGQHDVVRLWDNTQIQRNDINALLLLQMTYLGSPVVYFGDEIGLTNGYYDNQAYSGFIWDESQWDYDIYNLVKTLGKAREEYSCLRTGIICHGEVDDAQMFLAFGRFDKNGSAITLCNKQGVVLQKEINVSRYNVSDGATLTDYLTGKTYKVKDGKVTVDVIPGGTLLVTGKESSPYRNQYEICEIGNSAAVTQMDEAVFSLEGNGSLGSTNDKIAFLEVKAFNNAALSADVSGGEAGLMFRDTLENNSAFYAAILKDGKLTVQKRTATGKSVETVLKETIPQEATIRIMRENGNTFVTCYRETPQSEWVRLEQSSSVAALSETMHAGMFVLDGKAEFSNVSVESLSSQICEDFENEIIGSMFGTLKDTMSIEEGKLLMDSREDKLSYLSANAHSSDWTFKTQITDFSAIEDAIISGAGVMSMTDESDYLALLRMKESDQVKIALVRCINGKWQILGSVEDKDPKKPVSLQLQRIGSLYTAVASYDGKSWIQIGDSVYCNYTEMYAGICTYNAKASFEYGCFGNSIEDSVTTNTPMTLGEISTDYAKMLQNIEADKMAFVGNEDTWEDIGAGYRQNSAKGISLLLCDNKLFESVKAEATFTFESKSGSAGILLGKQNDSGDTKECYKIALNSQKELTISVDGKELAFCKLTTEEDAVRLVVRREGGKIHVLAGENATPMLSVNAEKYEKGYVAYFTEDAKTSITNYDITVLESNWFATKTVMGTHGVMEVQENDALISLEGVGLTEGILAFQANTKLPDTSEDTNVIGAILGGSSGRKSGYGGVSIEYNYKTGILEAKELEECLGKAVISEPATMEGISLMIKFQNGKYDIYANQSEEPVLSVTASVPNGGGVSLYSSKGTTAFFNTKVCDLTGCDDIETLEIVKEWRAIAKKDRYTLQGIPAAGTEYKDDFADYKGWNQNFYKLKTDGADWYLEDELLKADSIIKNWNIATITNGLYQNVDIQMKVRFADYSNDNNSAFSINVGKQKVYAGRDDTGLSFTVFGSGLVRLYDTEKKETLNGWSTYKEDLNQWFTMGIKVKGQQVTISIDGKEVYTGKVDTLKTGYIALQSDYVNLEIDDLSIRPLS